MQQFNLTDEDQLAIEAAIDVARKLLRRDRTTASHVIGLGYALLALERLPSCTPGVQVEYGVTLREGDESYRETRICSFLIGESVFEIYRGGSVYDKSIGSDRFSLPGWHVESCGSASRDYSLDLTNLDYEVEELLTLGATVNVSIESDITEIDIDLN